jgi:hypothetical protein
MAHGTSGRVVIDLDPAFKQELYDTLKQKGMNMRAWFLTEAQKLCEEHRQPPLAFPASLPDSRTAKENTSLS